MAGGCSKFVTHAVDRAHINRLGRVAFAGPYRGYGLIVIIEHSGGWTSLVTGLTQLDCRVGDQLVAGGSLGRAGPDRPLLTLELRRQGQAVNPLDFIRG